MYGEIESRTTKQIVCERWKKIEQTTYKILADNEDVIEIGDLNKHIGNDKLGVTVNHPKISVGGHLVRDKIAAGSLILVNNHKKCFGGPFARFDPSDPHNPDKMSCLDLVLV